MYLESKISDLARACPKGVNPETMVQVADLIVRRNLDLQKCTPDSILACMVEAGALGWNLSPKLCECYLIPFKNKHTGNVECTLMPGFRGLAKLARGDGKIESIIPRVVYHGDEFSVEFEPNTAVHHRPELRDSHRGPVTHVYCAITFTSGRKLYEVMTKDEIEQIRSYSLKKDGSFWRDHWEEMAKKTVIRRACKSLDSTPQLERAIELHDAEFDMETPKKLENNSGHATGQFATDEQAKTYLAECWSYCAKRNAAWLDQCTQPGGEIWPGTKDLITSDWQMDGHLLKWAIGQGLLDPASAEKGIRNHNKGKLVAIPYHQSPKHRNDIKRELVVYLDDLERQERDRMARLHPGEEEEASDADRPEAEIEPPDDTPF
jgi:recombination protein RecT